MVVECPRHALLRTVEKSGPANQIWPHLSRIVFFKRIQNRQNYHSGEPYPYVLLSVNLFLLDPQFSPCLSVCKQTLPFVSTLDCFLVCLFVCMSACLLSEYILVDCLFCHALVHRRWGHFILDYVMRRGNLSNLSKSHIKGQFLWVIAR